MAWVKFKILVLSGKANISIFITIASIVSILIKTSLRFEFSKSLLRRKFPIIKKNRGINKIYIFPSIFGNKYSKKDLRNLGSNQKLIDKIINI